MVEISDHLLPISKADMWSLWVGRCLHTLVTCIAQPKSDPRWGWYLVKFRSHREYLESVREWNRWLPTWIYLNSMICNSFRDGEWTLSFFLKEDNSTLPCWYNLSSLEFWLGRSLWDEWGIGIVIVGEYVWQVWMPIPGMGDWQARYLSKWWVRGG